MRLLLDTHVFLWAMIGDPRLPVSAERAIRDPANEVYLSTASIWEAVIKQATGKLTLPAAPASYLPAGRRALGIQSLPIEEECFLHLAALPLLHRDPFDRIMIAQALQHRLTLVSFDAAIQAYPVPLFSP